MSSRNIVNRGEIIRVRRNSCCGAGFDADIGNQRDNQSERHVGRDSGRPECASCERVGRGTEHEVWGFAAFRLATRPPGAVEETAVPIQALAAGSVTLPFANTGTFVTGIALANASTSAGTITATFWDGGGASLGTQSIPVAAGIAIVLTAQVPATSGKHGLVRLQGAAISAMALRFTPAGTFISLPAIQP